MPSKKVKTEPCLLEAGLPCASLSAECQRDNNARQRPPQNRLHIWWARRPPTICRAAILAALLPKDFGAPEHALPEAVSEPGEDEIENLPPKYRRLRDFFESLIDDIKETPLPETHKSFLKTVGVTGDVLKAYHRLAAAEGADEGRDVILGSTWGYRHPPAFHQNPASELVRLILEKIRENLQLEENEPIIVLDNMAGGGTIPMEAVRYGFKMFANDLNPVASLVLKATIEYPAKFGRRLGEYISKYSAIMQRNLTKKLLDYFPLEKAEEWWPELENEAEKLFYAKTIVERKPDLDHIPIMNTYLWCRIVPCSKCELNIPISTNFHLVNKKGKP